MQSVQDGDVRTRFCGFRNIPCGTATLEELKREHIQDRMNVLLVSGAFKAEGWSCSNVPAVIF